MKIIADTHTHTIRSGDAFSTLKENIIAAKNQGVKYLCMTEHAYSVFPDAPKPVYFKSQHALPREYEGVTLIRGVETNIINYDGTLDMPDEILNWLDWVIASMHSSALKPKSERDHTEAWIAVARNPLVDVIGHCDDIHFSFDIEAVIPEFAKNEKIVEVNNQSEIVRKGSKDFAKRIFTECKKNDVKIVVSSDGHYDGAIARFDRSLQLLKEIDYPEELIINADEEKFKQIIQQKVQEW